MITVFAIKVKGEKMIDNYIDNKLAIDYYLQQIKNNPKDDTRIILQRLDKLESEINALKEILRYVAKL